MLHNGAREILTAVDLCNPDGRLSDAAIGWSRRPLHRANLTGRWPRKKRWDYWCVVGPTHLCAITLADIDYLGLAVLSVLDLESGEWCERIAVTPLGLDVHLPDAACSAIGSFDRYGVDISIDDCESGVRLRAEARNLKLDFTLSHAGDSLSVVVPWSDRRFQLTTKQVGIPARGDVHLHGRHIVFDEAWACRDFGRGIWPRRTHWRWAAGAGLAGRRAVAVNLGGRWTDGTGATENGLFLDGHLHKIHDDLTVDARGVRGPRVDLRFVPTQGRRVGVNLGLASARLRWSFGHFSGTLVTDDGERLQVDGLRGWSEVLVARW